MASRDPYEAPMIRILLECMSSPPVKDHLPNSTSLTRVVVSGDRYLFQNGRCNDKKTVAAKDLRETLTCASMKIAHFALRRSAKRNRIATVALRDATGAE